MSVPCILNNSYEYISNTNTLHLRIYVYESVNCVFCPRLHFTACKNAKLWFTPGTKSSAPWLQAAPLTWGGPTSFCGVWGGYIGHQKCFPAADRREVIWCNWGRPISPLGVTAGLKICSGSALNFPSQDSERHRAFNVLSLKRHRPGMAFIIGPADLFIWKASASFT